MNYKTLVIDLVLLITILGNHFIWVKNYFFEELSKENYIYRKIFLNFEIFSYIKKVLPLFSLNYLNMYEIKIKLTKYLIDFYIEQLIFVVFYNIFI